MRENLGQKYDIKHVLRSKKTGVNINLVFIHSLYLYRKENLKTLYRNYEERNQIQFGLS